MAGNPTCEKQGHEMHICAMKESGFDRENPDKFREITENPRYKCDTCGAKAKNSENLCKPVSI